ncbi:MAG: holo-ACP synthase [Deltaproteobacteria bacterium]|nr:holo-ACP synthase [Deltaproteobacteria bacterium]
MIYGIGIDAVDVSRFRTAMERRGERLLQRLFTQSELDYCMGKKAPEVHLAARFAGKVSFIKAIGRRFDFRDVEITRDPDGRPSVAAKGLEKGFRVNISITHDGGISLAETIVEKSE